MLTNAHSVKTSNIFVVAKLALLIFCRASSATTVILLFSSYIYASPAELGEIEVIAPDTAPAQDASASSQVITPKNEETKTTTQIIEKNPGIHVKRYGSSDDSASISIRGAPSNQINIYYDNVPLNSAAGNQVNMSLAPPENLGKIEIYRGGAPGKAKEGSPAGAIFLQTLKRPEKFEAKFSNSYGSFKTYTGNLQIAQPFEHAWYRASFEHSQSSGDFTYLDDNGTRSNTSDDTLTKRINNDHRSENLLLKFGWDDETWKIETSNTTLLRRQGIPGLGSFQSTSARLNTDRNITIFNGSFKENHMTVFFDYLNDRFYDPKGEIGLGIQNNSDSTYRIGEEYFRTFEIGKFNSLFISASHTGEFYRPINLAAANQIGDLSTRNQFGIVTEDTIKFMGDRVIISPSIRLAAIFNHLSGNDPSQPSASQNTANDYQLTGKIGTKIRLVSELYAKGNVYRGFRNPNFSELFGDRGTLVGNPALKPEKAINFDLGLLYDAKALGKVDRLRLEATYFRNSTSDLIQFVQTSQFTAKPQNLASAMVQGVETTAQIDYLNHISHSIGYTFQEAKDTSSLSTSGKILPGRPRHELWIESSVYNDWGKIFGEYNFMSGNFLDSQNLLEIRGRRLLNAGIVATPAKWVLLSFNVKNIFNNRIVDVIGFPLPGRSYWGVVTLRI